MSRARATFVCSVCGAIAQKWQGRCEACNAWNTLHEEAATKAPSSLALGQGRAGELLSLAGKSEPVARLAGGMAEFDHVIGGGFVAGSALLVGGDPGIGKSTLLLQIAAAMAQAGSKIVYVSGEEAIEQVRMRAERLGLRDAPVLLVAETRVEDILATVKSAGHADLIIADSIQTLWTDIADSAPGTVTQVRNSTQALIRHAKSTGTIVVLVGHVTKDGQIAGPRVVEHMVDAVLYFEGDSGHQYRILRTVKNRFGPAGEIGLFEMTGVGLKEVASPSELFIGDKSGTSPGAAVLASLEGSRPILVEVQALVAESSLGTPRRAVVGWDTGRLAMILAVLEARCGLRFGSSDVYLNVAGGLRLSEPAADLAVAAALISARSGVAAPAETVYFGEISLSGAVRPVPRTETRLREAEKLGFGSAVLPANSGETGSAQVMKTPISRLSDLVAYFAGAAETSVRADPTS